MTGASGFAGGHLCRTLREKGNTVFALVRSTSKTEHLDKWGVKTIVGDLANPLSTDSLPTDIDTVFHVAAAYRQEGVSRDHFWKVNVEGTRTLLEWAKKTGVKRFVHCSTVGVQGEIANPPAKESAPYNPGDHYQVSKMEGEKLALSFFEQHDMEGVIVRPVGIYGPGDTRFLKLFKHIETGRFRMIGSGKVLYHLTYVEDLVQGFILAGEIPGVSGNVFTIGGAEYLNLNELVTLIAEILGKPLSRKRHLPLGPIYWSAFLCETFCRPLGIEPPIYRRRLDFFTKDRAFDISKAKEMLGYEPKVSLRQGLRITGNWYKANNLL